MQRLNRTRSFIGSFATLVALALAESQLAGNALAQQGAPPPPGGGQQQQERRGQDGGGQGQTEGGRQRNGQGGGGQRGGNMFGRGFGRMGGMFGGGGGGLQNQFRGAMEADFTRRDVPTFKDQLKLQEAQLVVLEQLMRDYEDAFNPAREEMQTRVQDMGRKLMEPLMNDTTRQKMEEAMQRSREQMEQLVAERGEELTPEERQQFFREQMEKTGEDVRKELKASGAFEQVRAAMKPLVEDFSKWRETKARLRKTVVDGLQGSLNEEQKARWPAFERFLAREKTLPQGTISGEQVNLFLVLDEAGLPKEIFETLTPIMDQYELALDEALRTRNEFLTSNETKFLEAVAEADQAGAKRYAERSLTLREKVRDVNDQYREAIMSKLSEKDAGRVRRTALQSAYERVYRPTQVERAFEAVEEMSGIEPTVLESIHSLQQSYGSEVGTLNEKLVQAIRKQEPAQQIDEIVRIVGMLSGDMSIGAMMGGQRDQGEMGELYEKRGELNEAYMARLSKLLTPEQIEALPTRGGGGGRGGRGAGGGGGGGGQGGGAFGGDGPIKLADLPEGFRDRVKEYDANNDGTIDEAERTKMMEAFRNRGGPGGGGGGGRGGAGGTGGQGGQGGGGGGGRGGS